MKKAVIVTITIGQEQSKYDTYFIPSIQAYASKWGFDFIRIRDFLEPVNPSSIDTTMKFKHVVCVQKFLILQQPWAKDYEYVIYMDADMLLNFDKAPNILDGLEAGKIGVVPERYLFGTTPIDASVFHKLNPTHPKTAEDYYKRYNFPQNFSKQFNAGLFVCQPVYHTDFFRSLYTMYAPRIYNGEDIDAFEKKLEEDLDRIEKANKAKQEAEESSLKLKYTEGIVNEDEYQII
jgi:hypothetical protein